MSGKVIWRSARAGLAPAIRADSSSEASMRSSAAATGSKISGKNESPRTHTMPARP